MNPFDKDFARDYELARKIGDSRFGSPCQHEQVKDGRCVDCQRRVIRTGCKRRVRRMVLLAD